MPEAPARSLRVVVVTPEKAVLNASAELVVVPMYDGELGVLPGRAPLIGRLGTGELRLNAGGSTRRLFVDGGFVQVRSDVVTVLTPKALPATAITAEVAARAEAEAESLPAGTSAELDRKAQARRRAAALRRFADRSAG